MHALIITGRDRAVQNKRTTPTLTAVAAVFAASATVAPKHPSVTHVTTFVTPTGVAATGAG